MAKLAVSTAYLPTVESELVRLPLLVAKLMGEYYIVPVVVSSSRVEPW